MKMRFAGLHLQLKSVAHERSQGVWQKNEFRNFKLMEGKIYDLRFIFLFSTYYIQKNQNIWSRESKVTSFIPRLQVIFVE